MKVYWLGGITPKSCSDPFSHPVKVGDIRRCEMYGHYGRLLDVAGQMKSLILGELHDGQMMEPKILMACRRALWLWRWELGRWAASSVGAFGFLTNADSLGTGCREVLQEARDAKTLE